MIRVILFCFLISSVLSAQIDDEINQVSRLLENNQKEEAKIILASLYEKNNKEPKVNYYLGVVSLMENNYDEAIDYLDEAIEGDETNPQYYFMIGNAYGVKAQNVGAFKAMFAVGKIKSNWEKAIELKPDFIDAYINLFQFHLQAPGIAGGSSERAREIVGQVAKLNKNLGHALQANYYLVEEENYSKAEMELTAALRTDYTDPQYDQIRRFNLYTLNSFGYFYLNKGMMPESRRNFSLAIETAPDQANPYDSMGDYYVKAAAYDSALVCFEHALKNDPDFIISKIKIGKMLEKLNRKSEAIVVYKALIKEAPDSDSAKEAEERLEEIDQ